MIEISQHVEERNLSRAWARAFLAITGRGVQEIVPLNVTVKGLDGGREAEERWIREALDRALVARGRPPCHTVSSTIFPASMWNPEAGREELFGRYERSLPKLKEASPANRYGLYFERLILAGPEKFNQLEHVISTYKANNHRRSALQASVFDATLDHTNQRRRGFPCLHQVSFTPLSGGKLAVSGFYATQHLFEKAYGNYLGLYGLGRFMAHEMGLELSQLNCYAAVARLGDRVSKGGLRGLETDLEEVLGETGSMAPTNSRATA